MTKILFKLATSSGVVTSACLANFSPLNTSATKQQEHENLKKVKSNLTRITSLDEIELFQKIHGCSFAFVSGWNDKQIYTFKKFLEKEKETDWNEKIITGTNTFKDKCKTKKSVALFYSRETQKFGLNAQQLPQ